MLSSIIGSQGITLTSTLICTGVSFGLGLLLAVTYIIQGNYSKTFVVSLAVLPILVQSIIMMVNGNIGTGVAVAGTFSLIRFRSYPGTARDITAIFAAMLIGLSSGMGYVGFGLIITLIFCVASIILTKLPFDFSDKESRELKLTIPESLEYNDVFADIFSTYTKGVSLERVRTTNMGTMFELTYTITLNEPGKEKQFIDELRCRNGNLPISINRTPTVRDGII